MSELNHFLFIRLINNYYPFHLPDQVQYSILAAEMNETSNPQLFISLSVSHHPGCHTVCFDSTGWWSRSSIPMEHKKYSSTDQKLWSSSEKSFFSTLKWIPQSSQAGINWQHQHWQHSARRSVTVFLVRRDVQQRLKHKLVLQPQSRAHSGGCHRAAQQTGTVLWLSGFGNLPRHRARRSHGKTALSSSTWLINATWLQGYTAAFGEFWSTKQEPGSYFQVNCTYSNNWFRWISVPNNVREALKPFYPF